MDKESALFYVVLVLFAVTGIVTLLGIVQKVAIEKKYLNALFSTLVLELIAAVMYLFSNTNFFESEAAMNELRLDRSALSEQWHGISGNELIDLVNAHDRNRDEMMQMEQQLLQLNRRFDEQNPSYTEISTTLDDKIREIDKIKIRHDTLFDELGECQILEKHFLVRMANLNSEIAALGGSVNLDWDPENKRRIAALLQVAFKQIGFIASHQQPDDNPAKALQLLVKYQESKRFGKTGFLTSAVVAIIIRDYLAQQSRNQSGPGAF